MRHTETQGVPLNELRFAVVDTETTGTSVWGGDRITEVAIVEVQGGYVGRTLSTLVYPQRPIPQWITSLTGISEELWDKVLAINVKGPFRLAALAAEHMAKTGGGSIINVSSVGAVQPTVGELPYAMAKSALHTMSAAMAHDYAGRVRVNVIMPGAFLTDISKAWPAEMRSMMERQIPMGRCGEPDEVVGAALYLASDASSYTSGAVIKIDGGWAYRAS